MSTTRRVASLTLGAGLLLVAAGAFAARYIEISGHPTLYAVIASPFLAFAAPLALLVLLWGRRWAMATVAGVLAAALVAVQAPWYVNADAGTDGVPVRAMTVNMLYGHADAVAVTELAATNADILLVQEFTAEANGRLVAAGINDEFPYQALEPLPEARGIGIFSRYPLTNVRQLTGYSLAMIGAQLRVDGAKLLSLISLHFAAPWPQSIDGWHADLHNFQKTLAQLADDSNGAPILIGGDFNATIDMKPFRRLLTNGYRDAAEQSGAGRELTFPANKQYPAFMGIDHFLTRNCTATSSRTVELPGTDHRALLATLVLPRDQAPPLN